MTTLILLNIITTIIASIIIFALVKSRRKTGLELERVKAREAHGMYEELDYVHMHTDCSKTVSTQDNVSYSMNKKAVHSDSSL